MIQKSKGKNMKKKYGTVIFLIWMLAMLQLAMTLQTAKSWYGETTKQNPAWNSTETWYDDGNYSQCHHRCINFYDDDNVWTSTGFGVHYDVDNSTLGYDRAHWYWTSGVANPNKWAHAQETQDTASVNLDTSNSYYDDSEPQWRTVFWFEGYMRYKDYESSEFDPPVTYVSGATAAGFYYIPYWDWYGIGTWSEPWDYMHARLE